MYSIYYDNGSGRQPIWLPGQLGMTHLLREPKLIQQFRRAAKLTFRMPPGNAAYSHLHLLTTTVYVFDDADCIFIGRIVSIRRDLWNQKLVTCTDALDWLNDAVMRPFNTENTPAFWALVNETYNAQAEDNRQIAFSSSIILGGRPESCDKYRTVFDTVMENGIDADRGGVSAFPKLTYDPDGEDPVTLTIQTVWVAKPQSITFGKNLLDLDELLDGTDVATAILPVGADVETGEYDGDGNPILAPLTIKSVNSGSDILTSSAGIAAFGEIVRLVQHRDIEDAGELKTAAQKDLDEAVAAALTLELSAVDLSLAGVDTSRLSFGMMYNVNSPPHGINNAVYQCRRVVLDMADPSRSQYTFGLARRTMTERLYRASVNAQGEADHALSIGAWASAAVRGLES